MCHLDALEKAVFLIENTQHSVRRNGGSGSRFQAIALAQI